MCRVRLFFLGAKPVELSKVTATYTVPFFFQGRKREKWEMICTLEVTMLGQSTVIKGI